MFKKLRNHFILINLVTTSLILIAAFSSIYIMAEKSSNDRRPIPNGIVFEFTEDNGNIRRVIEERIIADRKDTLSSLLLTLVITGVAVEIVVAIFSYLFAEQAIKPVKEAYESQKIFIANASHEIKTPVAAIKANLEAADLSEENHWIKNIELEADKIETLNLALLRLAKTDIVKESPTLEDVNLERTTKNVINSFSSRIEQKNIKLNASYGLKSGQKVKLCRADYKEILEILLDNAIKYGKTSIDLDVSPKSIEITNDGATIPAEKLPHVFDRFYQVDKSAEGSGLGLAIAKSLAVRNNWFLEVKSDSKTTSFELKF